MAFHPQYAANGQYFIYYTDAASNIVVERRSVSANPNLSDPTSALEIIRIPHPGFTNHFGGLLAFGPDGYLYLGTGDGGSAGDPPRNAQNLGVLLGKLLRLDVNAATAGAAVCDPGDQSVRRPGRAARRNLGLRAAQSLALRVRPQPAVYRRRRPGPARGSRHQPRFARAA